jgi:histidinol-phosphate aminotransferase
MDITKLIRKECEGFKPYVAGKPIETIKREMGLKSVIKLASNENPLGASKKALEAIKENLKEIFYYPDSNSYVLKKGLSEHYGLSVGNIFTGAGGDEIIELIAKVFFNKEEEIVISRHSFIRYEMAAKLMGSKAVAVAMKEGFKQDLTAMAKACTEKTKAVFVTNPNNPTGTYNNKEELCKFLKNIPLNKAGLKPIVVLDEAYFEYAFLEEDYPNGLDFLKENPNLIIFRTFSKIYGLAGLRVAYGFASEEIVNYIERTRPPFNVNRLAQIGGTAAIEDKEQVAKSLELVKEGKEYLYKEFRDLEIKYIKSAGNFILFNSSPYKGKELFDALVREGVIIRAMDEYELPDWVRVTIGLGEENELFIDKLKKIFSRIRTNNKE